MYKHILLPTDHSGLSRQAVAAGIQLARSLGASIVGMHALPYPHKNHITDTMFRAAIRSRSFSATTSCRCRPVVRLNQYAVAFVHLACGQ
jgi:nucleotide-binding universal stress UspA family protein